MQTPLSSSLFHSRIGRRILGLFVLCALVPTSLLGWISYRQVTGELILQASARLKQESKSQGMVLYSHLLTLSADLDRIAAELPHDGTVTEDITITASVKELGRRFQEIQLQTTSGPNRRRLTQAQIAHLQEGKALLEIRPSPDHLPQFTLTRIVKRDRWDAGLLSAHIDQASLWSSQIKEALPGDTDIVIEDGARQTLYTTFSQQVSLPDFRRHDIAAPMGEGALWRLDTQEYVAGAWTMPLRHTFLLDPWVIVLSQTKESALAPVEQFRHTFLLVIASALSAVVLLSLSQIRRSLQPVALLRDGTARLAAGDFSTHVTVQSHDEFQDLASSFNRMTDKLSQQFHMLETMSAIGQAILSSYEPATMVKIVQSRITETITCDAVGMAMVNPENTAPTMMSVRLVKGAADETHTYSCRLSEDHLAAMKAHPNHLVMRASDLPSYLTPMAGPDLSLFIVFPIIVNEVVSGALVLAYRQRKQLPTDETAHARRLADQVAVALANSRAIKARMKAQIELAGAVGAKQQAEERATLLQATNQALETKEERLRQQQSATLTLVQDRTVFEGSLPNTAKQVTTVAAQALTVSRVSVWLFLEPTKCLNCLDSYDQTTDHHVCGGQLVRSQCPTYFDALNQGELLSATHAQTDPHFKDFPVAAEASHQISSRMDAPFHSQGQLAGVVSIEQIGSSREWAPDEQQFAQALANFMTLVLEAARRRESEEALAVAKLAAEDATQAKAEFLANMSHEIRTPMNGVIGMTEILARTPLSDTQRHYIETIHHSGETLLTLINDILDFSKIEAGKLQIQSTPLDLRDIVERTVEQLAERAQRKGLQLLTDYDPSVPTAFIGDPLRIRQILTNLLGNAIKFTQEGDVSVTVTTEPAPSGEETISRIKLAVTDTGSGISSEGQTKLFRAFSQVDGSSTRVHGGTGLGLSICKQLSELMGGSMGIESVLGQGSTFWVILPLPLQSHALLVNQPDPTFNSLRVCMAIGHPATSRLITRYLTHWGIPIRAASTGTEFLELVMNELAINSNRVVALIDETFTDMTDSQLLQELMSDFSLTSAKIVRLVSFIRRAEVEEDPAFGHVHVVTKPVRIEAFQQALLNVLDEKPASLQHENAASPAPLTLSCRVLLGEDNSVNQEIAVLMLKSLGCSITVAQNGREVVDQAQRGHFDIILTDCQMPEMDGFEATRLIREWEQRAARPSIPIVALTAHATPGDRERCLASGMNDYLSKPFTMEHLQKVLTSWLHNRLPTTPEALSSHSQPSASTVSSFEGEEQSALIVDQKAWKSITSLQRPGKEDALAKILSLYLTDSKGLVQKIRHGIATGNAQDVNRAAHSLKSRSTALGAVSLSKLCRQFEELSRQGGLTELEPLVDDLEAAFTHASQIFQTELDRRAA